MYTLITLAGGIKMKRLIAMTRIEVLFAALMIAGFSASRAQISQVSIDLPSLDYDVIYLADLVDVTTFTLAKAIPNFNATLTADGSGYIVLHATVWIQLKGDASRQELVYTETNPFFVSGSRSLTASDLSGGSTSDIKTRNTQVFTDAEERLKTYAQQFPTAPVGQYFLQLVAFDSSNTRQLPSGVEKTITVRNASPEEVQVNLIDPQPGDVISTLFPTFSWNSSSTDVTLYVYEMLPVFQSLQEAVTGVPYLKQEVTGAQTFTYPVNAPRRLEQNASYVWFVTADVTTNRQTVQRQSELRLFRIRLSNEADQEISDIMNGFGGSASGTLATLQGMGWVPNGTMTFDGKPLTLDDLKALVAKLVAQNTQVTVRVE